MGYRLCCASSEGQILRDRGTHVILITSFVCDCGMWTTLKNLLLTSTESSLYINYNQTLQESLLLTFKNISFQLFSMPCFHIWEYVLDRVLCFGAKTEATITSAFFQYEEGTCCPVTEVHTRRVRGRVTCSHCGDYSRN